MENSPEFDRVARRTHDALEQMLKALGEEFNGSANPATVLTAMMTAAVAKATEFYLGGCVLAGVPFVTGRAELDRLVEDYWRQAVTRQITLSTRRKLQTERGSPNDRRKLRKGADRK